MGSKATPGSSWNVPSWVGDHQRRLTAYVILQSYFDNAARFFLYGKDLDVADDHREYGDAGVLRDTILAALLGDDQNVFTEGADGDLDAEDITPEEVAEIEGATALRDWLEEWAWERERFGLKMIETERNAVGLGDGVYVLGWSPDKKRVRLRVFDPGYYFPVLSDSNEDDYPTRVHIAWELETDDPGKRLVRRITWDLVDIEADETGNRVARRYPYAPDDDSFVECLMTDATWTLDLNRAKDVDDFSEGRAVYETYIDPGTGEEVEFRDVPLGIDFIPVVHLPNTVAIQAHYGKSSVERVLQILDDLSNADTDLQGASATTGKPPIGLSGVLSGATKPTWNPGELWSLGENGRATMIDTSNSLDALIKYVLHLLDRLNVSSRVPGSLMGRIKPSEVPSGVALALSFGPLRSMIDEMRLVRDEKYPLLLRFVWRMSVAAEAAGADIEVPDTWYPSRIEFGTFLPHDTGAVVEMVVKLLTEKAIGRKTAIRLLVAAGVDIEDAETEVSAIESEDFEGAVNIADATGSEAAAAEYLRIDTATPVPPGAPPIEPPVIPPTGEPPAPPEPTT